MSARTPQETTLAAVEAGARKARLGWSAALVGGFFGGAFIAIGGLLAITGSAGLDPQTWGTLGTLVTGTVFALGLVLVVLTGAELLTGNMALVPLAMLRRRATPGQLLRTFAWVLVGNLIGALFVAYFLAHQTGVIGDGPTGALALDRLSAIARTKALEETEWQIFLRAVGCNWLVCLAVWLAMAADDLTGKVVGIAFPVMAFVALGFDHLVANMFFLPAAIFAGVPDIGWADAVRNWVFAFAGNFAGALLFVACGHWFMHLRDRPVPAAPAGPAPGWTATVGPAAAEPAAGSPQAAGMSVR